VSAHCIWTEISILNQQILNFKNYMVSLEEELNTI